MTKARFALAAYLSRHELVVDHNRALIEVGLPLLTNLDLPAVASIGGTRTIETGGALAALNLPPGTRRR